MRLPLLSCMLCCALSPAWAQSSAPLPSLSDPAISPDGKEIAFASGGDLWTVPAAGGEARLLVTDPANESRPLYSPDGSKLAFVSTRTGNGDIYVLTLATGQLQRITFSDGADNLDGWSRDGKWIYFTSSVNDVAGQGDIFRVASSGGTPLEVSRERYLNEFESAPSPDGEQIALVAKGLSSTQWWRNGHAHIDETEIWLKPVGAEQGYKRVVTADAKHAWPMWSSDGHTLFFMSDKSGAENIWQLDVASGATKALTHFDKGRVLWPTISYDGRTILFERNFSVWRLDLSTGSSAQVKIALRGTPSSPGVTHLAVTEWTDLALSPDGKKIAVAGHGELFAAGAKDGGEAQRLTRTVSAESTPNWSPESNAVVYRSERDGGSSLYQYDFATSTERALTHGTAIDLNPTYSPDGKSIAFVRNRKELHVLALEGMKDQVIARGELEQQTLAWSPDSQWVAFVVTGTNGFANLHVVPAAGGEDRPITFLANGETGSRIAWSPDGKFLLFDTAQRSEQTQMARVDLIPHVPSFREDQFRELFKKTPDSPADPKAAQAPATETKQAEAETATAAKPGAKKKPEPVKIVFDGIRDRLTLMPLGLGVRSPVISPDGKTLLFAAEVAGQENLYTYSLDELAKEPPAARQLTSTRGRKGDYAFSPDSKEVFFLEGTGAGSSVQSISLEARTQKPVAVTASMDVDFDQEKEVVFDELWSTLNQSFFDPTFHGQDWAGLREQWRPYIAGSRTGYDLRRNLNLLIGELNASHSGTSKPSTVSSVRVGRLGLRWDRTAFESGRGLIVREIVPLGPAAIEGSIHVGDRLLAADGTTIEASTNLDALLEEQDGKRVVLSVAPGGDAAKKHDVVLRPVTTQLEVGLLYRAWVNDRRAYVDKISGGKLGYVHIADMSDASLRQLYLDLDALNQAKQGVVVDIRNNNGGYVNGYAIDVFARKNYLLMTPRDEATIPSRQALGQRALGLPTVLVTNESSLSDAEDFTEGYRTLGLGKVVGTPTAGWIIFTGAHDLIDGSVVRVPGDRVRDTRGQDMEMHPRPVDVEVERPLGETESGHDAQLEKAVEVLLAK
ncbi:MAG TPA: S41 family peptidase [Granulicella sp.]|nr:S41 family peptidase [Granulicella sp.]